MRPLASPVRFALPVAVLLTACGLIACGGGDSDTPRTPVGPPNPTMGAVQVTTATSGATISANRYVVRLGARSTPIALSGSVRIEDVPAGTQSVSLDSVPPNCDVRDGASRTVSVIAGATGSVAFTVTCVEDFSGATLQPMVCGDLVPSASSARPLQELAIGRLPSVLQGPLMARMSTGQGSATSLGMVLLQPDGCSEVDGHGSHRRQHRRMVRGNAGAGPGERTVVLRRAIARRDGVGHHRCARGQGSAAHMADARHRAFCAAA